MLASTTPQKPSDQARVDACVEYLCNQGCKAVWGYIAVLERGESIPGFDGLDPSDVSLVLKELKAVMACYEGSCTTGVSEH